jgi:hypothetical protein
MKTYVVNYYLVNAFGKKFQKNPTATYTGEFETEVEALTEFNFRFQEEYPLQNYVSMARPTDLSS